MKRIALVLAAACLTLAGCGGSEGDADGAIASCHQSVEQQLTSPDSADFPRVPEHDVLTVSENEWRVSSYVDAEDPFGDHMRAGWICDISYSEASATWTLNNLSGL